MKIAYLSHGESIHDQRFLSKMVEYGHEPYLISYFGKNLVNVDGVKIYKYNYRSLYKYNRYLTTILDTIPFLGFQFTKKVLTFQVAYHLKKLLKKIKPDILHTNFIHYEGFFGALAGFRPMISMPWGSDILINPEGSLFDRLVAKYTLKRSDMIVCDCELVRNKIVELAHLQRSEIAIVFCGVDQNIFNKNASGTEIRAKLGVTGKKILLMNRNFRPVYGIEYFIEALPIIIRMIQNIFVIMIGEGPSKVDCQTKVNEMGLHDYVCFPGFVNETEMAKYLNAADIYVSTSLSDGTSVSLLEAIACGLPVVVSDIPANLEWVKNDFNGLTTEIEIPKSIAQAIIKLLNDPAKMKLFGERNRGIAEEKADWDNNYQKLDRIYRELVGKNDG